MGKKIDKSNLKRKALLVFSHQLTENQEKELIEEYSVKKIEKLPDDLQNLWSNVTINKGYKENLDKIKNYIIENFHKEDVLVIQGNWGYTYNLVKWAIKNEYLPLYSYTERNVEEIKDGENVKVQWSERAWDRDSTPPQIISEISCWIVPNVYENKKSGKRYRISNLWDARTRDNLWFTNRNGGYQCIVNFDYD